MRINKTVIRAIYFFAFVFGVGLTATHAQDFTIARSNGSSGLGICPGENVSFMAGISATSYTWYINESIVTTDLNVGQPQVLIKDSWGYAVGASIRCVAQTTEGPKYSNTLITTTCVPPQLPTFTVGITVEPFRYPPVYCADEVTFVATASHNATIVWYKNGQDVSATSSTLTTSTYVPTGLTSSDVISVIAYVSHQSSVANPTASATLDSQVFSIAQPVGEASIFSSENTTGVCQGKESNFYATAANAKTFQWSINPSNAGTISITSENGSSCKIDWTPSYSGMVSISVTAAGCNGDTRSASKMFEVYSEPTPLGTASSVFCEFEIVSLVAEPTSSRVSFNWYDNANNLIGSGSRYEVSVLPVGTYQYKVAPISNHGCISSSLTDYNISVVTDCDSKLNWIENIAYDENEIEINHSKTYFDLTGRTVQMQTKTFTKPAILATQSLVDKYGREVLTTLPAPTLKENFQYDHKFVRSSPSTRYSPTDFDGPATKNMPNPVNDAVPGTLGWYYSANNTVEPFAPRTAYPYNRIDFYNDGSGETKIAASAGDQHRMGTGHEILSASFPLYNELEDYLSLRPIALPGIAQDGSLLNEGIQSITKDENGNYSISISDKEGNVVLSGRKGSAEDNVLVLTNEISSSSESLSSDYRPFTYFYILDPQPVSISSVEGTVYSVENIVSGLTYSEPENGHDWEPGFYRIILTSGSIELSYSNYLVDVSYQFYDDAGRLRSSVSPNGFKQLKHGIAYSNIDKTDFTYNHRGWLLSMVEPDAGETKYIYRNDGKIRFSQNAEQRLHNRFSYTHYDEVGRPVESGEYIGAAVAFVPMNDESFAQSDLELEVEKIYTETSWSENEVKDWVRTHYDDPTNVTTGNTQEYVRGTVSWTENRNIKTYYSYDEFGRVAWIEQQPQMKNLAFVTNYTYDFLGNVIMVKHFASSNQGELNTIYHHYTYDADKRLYQAFTSLDGANKKIRATYEYYLHGPLKRIELGDKLQGIDFVYNINGWLTHINHPDRGQDPGKDGAPGEHSEVRPDVFGMVLDYYESDMNNLYSVQSGPPIDNMYRIHGLPSDFVEKLVVQNQPLIRLNTIENPSPINSKFDFKRVNVDKHIKELRASD